MKLTLPECMDVLPQELVEIIMVLAPAPAVCRRFAAAVRAKVGEILAADIIIHSYRGQNGGMIRWNKVEKISVPLPDNTINVTFGEKNVQKPGRDIFGTIWMAHMKNGKMEISAREKTLMTIDQPSRSSVWICKYDPVHFIHTSAYFDVGDHKTLSGALTSQIKNLYVYDANHRNISDYIPTEFGPDLAKFAADLGAFTADFLDGTEFAAGLPRGKW